MSALKFLGIFFLALGIVKSVQAAILYAKERLWPYAGGKITKKLI